MAIKLTCWLIAAHACLFPFVLRAQTVELIQMPLAALRAKADAGDAPAMVQLGLRYSFGVGVMASEPKRNRYLIKAAQAGNLAAKGICAANAYGCSRDLKLAFECFEKGSQTGDLTAIRNLARCYEEGEGCKADEERAMTLYQQAIVADDPVAIFALAQNVYLRQTQKNYDPARGFAMLERAAARSTAAKTRLANCLYLGIGCQQDEKRAFKLYTEAAEDGNPDAMRVLCWWYKEGRLVSKNMSMVRMLLESAGELGDGLSLATLGDLYLHNPEMNGGFAKYEECMLKAGEQGFGSALYSLGRRYMDGDKVEQDMAKARQLYAQAVELGCADACTSLGVVYDHGLGVERNLDKANELYLKAGEMGSGRGYCNLGINCESGNGMEPDMALALCYYERAVELKDPWGFYAMGLCHHFGKATPVNYARAKEFYEKGMALGEHRCCCKLGMMYAEGEGVKKDPLMALAMLKRSADKGVTEAMNYLGTMFLEGRGVRKNVSEAFGWYQKSAESGSITGKFRLGLCYYRGEGVQKNLPKAVELFSQAGTHYHAEAIYYLGLCFQNGYGVAKDLAKAGLFLQLAAKLSKEKAQEDGMESDAGEPPDHGSSPFF